MSDVYILNKPGSMICGSRGETNESGRMIWSASPDAMTIGVDLIDNLAALAAVLGDSMTAGDAGPHFTCGEAQAIADVLDAAGHTEAAAAWLDGHAGGDNDPEDMHYRGEETP